MGSGTAGLRCELPAQEHAAGSHLSLPPSFTCTTPQQPQPSPHPPPQVWDLRREEISMSLAGHSDSITGMRLSPDGTHLLTNSMDNTLR